MRNITFLCFTKHGSIIRNKLLKRHDKFNDIKNIHSVGSTNIDLSTHELQKYRTDLYDKEVKRQNSLITDIEKIRVKYRGFPEDCDLMMNKNLSTPYDCCQHLHQTLMDNSVLADVDGQLWDMFKPLVNNCNIKFLHFREQDPFFVNKAFWKSMSFMLGMVLENTFKDSYRPILYPSPIVRLRSGSFFYDIELPVDWTPTQDEIRIFSTEIVKLSMSNLKFNRIEVSSKLAYEVFQDDKFKIDQIDQITEKNSDSKIVLYRVGDHIDIDQGPMINFTGHLGKCKITSVHKLKEFTYRIQGVALPKGFHMNYYTWAILENRAKKLNSAPIPESISTEKEI